jgi:hypothetical protein
MASSAEVGGAFFGLAGFNNGGCCGGLPFV